MCCIFPLAYAIEGDIDVTEVIAYVETAKYELDWDDDTIIVKPDQILQVRTTLENDYNESVEVEFRGEIDLFTSTTDKKKITLDDNDEGSVVLQFTIPPSTSYGIYELTLRYEYTVNGTKYNHKGVFEVSVKKEPEAVIQKEDIWQNLTKELVDQKKVTNSLLATNYNCTYELATCKENLGKTSIAEDYKGMYTNKNTAYDQLNSQLTSCYNERSNMVSRSQHEQDIQAVKNEYASKSSGDTFRTILIIALIGAVIFLFWKNKNRVESTEQGTQLRREQF